VSDIYRRPTLCLVDLNADIGRIMKAEFSVLLQTPKQQTSDGFRSFVRESLPIRFGFKYSSKNLSNRFDGIRSGFNVRVTAYPEK
jgi:hypothetical protein